MNDSTSFTMKDIARELGVSVATVSRALKDSPRISTEQKERIKKFAREHNFYPNLTAEQLRHNRVKPSNIIGVIIPQIAHYYFSTILSGIEEQARIRGYNIMVAQSEERYDLANMGVPLVFYDRICTGINASRVVVDDYMGAFTAVTHLIETGCRRIAFYGASMKLEISKNRYNGYRDALLRHGLQIDESLEFICDNRADAEMLTPEVLSREDRPDAFFAINDDTAIGILYTAKRMGFKVPDDVSICGFTNGERAVACDPMLTTVEQRGHMVGEEAVDVLVAHVEGLLPSGKIEKKVVRTRLVVRGTTR